MESSDEASVHDFITADVKKGRVALKGKQEFRSPEELDVFIANCQQIRAKAFSLPMPGKKPMPIANLCVILDAVEGDAVVSMAGNIEAYRDGVLQGYVEVWEGGGYVQL